MTDFYIIPEEVRDVIPCSAAIILLLAGLIILLNIKKIN